jgi:hypothetical protein
MQTIGRNGMAFINLTILLEFELDINFFIDVAWCCDVM